NPLCGVTNFSFVRALALTGLQCHSQGILRNVTSKPTHRSSPNATSRETQTGQLARPVHADCRPNVTASWNTVQLLGVPQEGKGQADLLRRLKVFGRKQSLPSSGVPVRAAGTRSRYKVGIYSDIFERRGSAFISTSSARRAVRRCRNKFRPTMKKAEARRSFGLRVGSLDSAALRVGQLEGDGDLRPSADRARAVRCCPEAPALHGID